MSHHNSSDPRSSHVVEQRSIDYVPLNERRGKLWHQGPFWFTSNFVLLTMVTGFIGPSLGLSVWWSIIAIIGGAGFGTLFMAFHANQGPTMGLPQMIQSRAQFGSRGVIFPFIATVFVYIGFMVFDTILATDGLQHILPLHKFVLYPAVIAISIVIAVVGHDLLHLVQRWLTYALLIVFAILTVTAILNSPGGIALDYSGGWKLSAFLIQFSLAAGYNISYSVYVSDYTRYLPEKTSSPKLISWVYVGAAGSATWLMSLGAILADSTPTGNAIQAIKQLGDLVFPGFGTLSVVLSAVALITVMGVNAYGAMLTGTSAVDGFRPVRATVRLRVVGLVVAGIVTLVVALLIPEEYLDSFNDFVVGMLYFLIPWTSINLVDYYFVRNRQYAITEIFNPNGMYRRWSWPGVVAYLAGFVAMIPFFVTSFYEGPLAQALHGADFSFIVGIAISAGLYLLFNRNKDMTAELEAKRESRRLLEQQQQEVR